MSCYKQEVIKTTSNIQLVDNIYILTTTDADRLKETLKMYALSNKFTVVYNTTYKNCNKAINNIKVSMSYQDIFHANQYIYTDALMKIIINLLLY